MDGGWAGRRVITRDLRALSAAICGHQRPGRRSHGGAARPPDTGAVCCRAWRPGRPADGQPPTVASRAQGGPGDTGRPRVTLAASRTPRSAARPGSGPPRRSESAGPERAGQRHSGRPRCAPAGRRPAEQPQVQRVVPLKGAVRRRLPTGGPSVSGRQGCISHGRQLRRCPSNSHRGTNATTLQGNCSALRSPPPPSASASASTSTATSVASRSASTRRSCRSPTSRWPPSSAPESLGRMTVAGS